MMKYLSTFSGIEAATAAWHSLGWEPVGFSEIEPFPCAVLAHHYPQVKNYGDITQFRTWSVEPFRLLVGGSPCQSFSVAGLRKGLADERGNLMLEFGRLAQHYRPTWVVWENVPGVLSSNGGRDFASFLGMLAEFGYGFAYRVLDAQYFGVAQRRRRVFVVGYLGDWRPAAAALFESHSLSGHPAPSRKAGKGTAKDAQGGIGGGSHWDNPTNPHPTLNQSNNIGGIGQGNQEVFSQRGGGLVPHAFKMRGGCDGGGKGYLGQDECAFTISTNQDQQIIQPISFQSVDDGSDASENLSGTLRSHDPMAVAQPIPIDSMNHLGRGENHPMGDFIPGAPSYTITKAHHHAVAQPMAFQQNTRDEVRYINGDGQIAGALSANAGMKQQNYIQEPITYDMTQVTSPINVQSRNPEDPCHTLAKGNAGNAAVVQPIAYAFDSLASNSMKSSNPVSGCNQTEVSKTLDTTDPNPTKNQGGMAVVQPITYDMMQVTSPTNVQSRKPGDPCHTISRDNAGNSAVVQPMAYGIRDDVTPKFHEELSGTLGARDFKGPQTVMHHMAVRRLSPRECERLQGFPDDFTNIPWRGKPDSPDGPRYKALGNSMAVPVMRWIGERIQAVEELMNEMK